MLSSTVRVKTAVAETNGPGDGAILDPTLCGRIKVPTGWIITSADTTIGA